MAGVGTAILGRPRRLPGNRPQSARYTVNCEEPTIVIGGRVSVAAATPLRRGTNRTKKHPPPIPGKRVFPIVH